MSWIVIKGGGYAVSDDGQVMSLSTYRGRVPTLIKHSIRRGYPSVCIGRKQVTIHSLVASAFIGTRPSGMQVNHIDGNKRNNDVSNLEYVTPSQNRKHSFRVGLQSSKGEKHSQHKLNDYLIIKIRERLQSGESQTSIAKSVGIDPSEICRINSGERWSHVPMKGRVTLRVG